jgi:cytosine/adenosine deaminase-related metal-dependent hydrolase
VIVGPATLVAGGVEPRVQPHAALRVVGAHVAAIAPYADLIEAYPEDPRWETEDRIVLPGLVNGLAYPHASLAEGLAGYGEIGHAADAAHALADGLDAQDLYLGALAALVQGLRQGATTTFLVASPLAAGGEGLAAIAQAAEETKVRACVVGVVTDRNGPAAAKALLAEATALVKRAKKGWGDRLRAMIGVGPLAEVSRATLAEVAEAVHASGAGVFARVAETDADARDARERHDSTPLGRLATTGLLHPRAIVAPGRALPISDWTMLRDSGAAWVSTPREDVEASATSLDAVELSDSGVRGALGTGGLTPNLRGECEAMYRAARLAKHSARDAKRVATRALFEQGPELAQRHFVAGLGRLETGAPADLIVLDAYPPTPIGPENWTDHLMEGLAAAPVHAVVVAGEILMQDGRLTVVDERDVQKRTRTAVHRLWPRVTA